jgi:hypothetical protein
MSEIDVRAIREISEEVISERMQSLINLELLPFNNNIETTILYEWSSNYDGEFLTVSVVNEESHFDHDYNFKVTAVFIEPQGELLDTNSFADYLKLNAEYRDKMAQTFGVNYIDMIKKCSSIPKKELEILVKKYNQCGFKTIKLSEFFGPDM